VVVAEILQGLIRNADRIERFLGQGLAGIERFSNLSGSGRICRAARGKGTSLRPIDTLIAAIALEYDATVFTLDHDFSRIALSTRLVLHRF
jgi:predicted nucleic acid-binding protein